MKHISIVPNGYLVRLCYKNDAPKYQRFFAFGTCKETALKRAKQWRKKILKRMKVMGELKRPHTRRKPQKNNSTGFLGIVRDAHWSKPDKEGNRRLLTTYKSFFICDDGTRKNLSFAESVYGENAIKLAILSRQLQRRATNKDLKKYINKKK